MDAIGLLRMQFGSGQRLLADLMSTVSQEDANWLPGGKAHSIGVSYAHIAYGQDRAVHGILQGGAPLFATEWAGRTGMSELHPNPGLGWEEWSNSVTIDLEQVQRYAAAVSAATEAYLASLTNDDLARELDFSQYGLGMQSVAWVINGFIIGHLANHSGEIAAIKGLRGLKGYAF